MNGISLLNGDRMKCVNVKQGRTTVKRLCFNMRKGGVFIIEGEDSLKQIHDMLGKFLKVGKASTGWGNN